MSIRRVVLSGVRRFEVEEGPAPVPGAGEALVRIGEVGICGSDMQLYRSGGIGPIRVRDRFVIGHECMGEVVAIGEGADPGLVGRRVAVEPAVHCGTCRWCQAGRVNVCPHGEFLGLPPRHGALQESLVHPAELLVPLPDEVSDEAGVMLEPLAIALHAVDLAQPQPGQSIAILGTGVLGTCVFELLRERHAAELICVDLLQPRLDRVAGLGAARVILAERDATEAVVARVREATDGLGADVVFECAGASQTQSAMCELAAPGAVVAVIGSNEEDRVSFSASSARRKGLRMQFVRRSLHTLERALGHARAHELGPLVTHRFAASRAQQAFELVDGYGDGVLKAVVDLRDWAQAEAS